MVADNAISLEEALGSTDAECWKEAIKAENEGLVEKGVLATEGSP